MAVEAIERGEAESLGAGLVEAKRRLASGDQEGALALLGQLITDDAGNVPARFLLAFAAWRMGRLDWSLALVRECHESRPMDGVIAEVLASLYAQAGNLRESLFMGKLATALKAQGPLLALVPPEFPGFDWAFHHITENPKLAAAEASLADGMIDLAVENARQHAALNPEDGAAQCFYAALLVRTGAAAKAVEVLRRTESEPDAPGAQASLYARALAAVGDVDAARRWHDEAVARAPDDAEVAAARVADSIWLERDHDRRATIGRAWARRFCPSPKPRQWARPRGKLAIGYIVSAFADPQDAAHVAAVARSHDRANTVVVGYGIGAQSWEANLPFQGAFDLWQDIALLDPESLALFFERDRLNLIVDVAGFAAPANLAALARSHTAIRLAWLGNEGRVAEPVYDAQLVAASAAQAAPPCWPAGGGYPLLQRPAAPRQARSGDAPQFGADAGMAQIDGETVRLWSAVLRRLPDAKLLLRAQDMSAPANIDRLVARFGRDLAARIDIIGGEDPSAFYARVDVALAPAKGMSPRMAADALACGVPCVALGGAARGGIYASFLDGVGLAAALVAQDAPDYAERASRLAASPDARGRALAALAASPWAGEAGTARFARAIEDHARRALNAAEALAS